MYVIVEFFDEDSVGFAEGDSSSCGVSAFDDDGADASVEDGGDGVTDGETSSGLSDEVLVDSDSMDHVKIVWIGEGKFFQNLF